MIFLNKLPFLRILFPFTIGIAFWLISRNDSVQLLWTIGVYILCLLLYYLSIKQSKTFTKVLFGIAIQVFLFLSGWLLCAYNNDKQTTDNYSNYNTTDIESYSGYVSELPVEKTKSIKAEIILQQIKYKGIWQAVSGKMIVYFEKADKASNLEIENTIVFIGKPQEIQAPLNPREFDYKAYLNFKNIYHSVYLKDESWVVVDGVQTITLFSFTQKIRKQLLNTYRQSGLQNTEFAMVAALVLGYDDEIDRPLLNAYSHTGTLHVLSVSGLHVGIIYMLLGYMLSFLDRTKKTTWIKVFLILGFLWFFVLLSGFSAAAVRAAFMFSLITLGKTLFHINTKNDEVLEACLSNQTAICAMESKKVNEFLNATLKNYLK